MEHRSGCLYCGREPRCCKRNSFLAIGEAQRFTKEQFGIEMGAFSDAVACEFYHLNKECRKVECPFYQP